MSSLEDSAPPDDTEPGWHPDPLGGVNERHWDGEKWTTEMRKPEARDTPASAAETSNGAGDETAKPDPETKNDGFRRWVRQRPVWAVSIAAGAAFVVAIALAAIGNSSDLADKDDQIASLRDELVLTKNDLSDSEVRAAEAETEAEKVKDRVADKEKAVERQAARVSQREEKVSQAEAVVKKNTITDGIWQVGVDFDPGTYRADGGSGCYWAQLNSADTNDIESNGGFGPNQTLTLDSGWFETQDCGEWVKIG